MKNTLLLDTLHLKPTPRRPIWLMRQAGRYLPEYRAVKERAGSFMALCQNPELACEVTLQPITRFDLDAAILFSDILTIPDAMGLGLHFAPDHGPRFETSVDHAAKVRSLKIDGLMDRLQYVFDAVSLIKQALNESIPLLGFAGSPWTLATYMVEGGTSKQFSTIKRMCYQDPELLKQILAILTEAVTEYLSRQIEAGVNAVQIFDTWAGILSDATYQCFSLDWIQQIVSSLKERHPDIPIILFSKQSNQWLSLLKDLPIDCLSVDWTLSLSKIRTLTEDKFALQGNLDPHVLLANPEVIEASAKAILDDYGSAPGHIFNLGHGITPDIPPEHVAALVSYVKSYQIK